MARPKSAECSGCGTPRPEDDSSWRAARCPGCAREAAREAYWRDPEKARSRSLAYGRRNAAVLAEREREKRASETPEQRERRLARMRERARERRLDPQYRARVNAEKRTPESRQLDRDHYSLKKYGLTREGYLALLETQGGVCAICGGQPKGNGARYGRFSVDHDHVTGLVRGLLCSSCNTAIGLLGDEPETVLRAALYLEHWRT